MQNISLLEVALLLGLVSESQLEVSNYQVDSRSIEPGGLFFALKGERSDGHLHLAEARRRGAIGAVVSKGYQGPDFGLVLLPVEDVLEGLQALAKENLNRQRPYIVAITGSVGKTTTKDFAATILSASFRVHKSPASHNTKLTLPLTILNRPGGEEVLVLEMGMSEPGDIRKLVEIAPPDMGVVTKIALAHAAFFPGGIEEISRGKREIFSHPHTTIAVFPYDLQDVPADKKKVSFSLDERASDYFLSAAEGRFYVDERGIRAYQFDLPFKQSHILHDFLAAVAIARQLKMSWDEINRQVASLQMPHMRFEQFAKNGVQFVNDAYNANPESMRAALSNFPEPKEGGKRIAVLASMLELGSFSVDAHREAGQLAQRHADHLLVFGEEAAPLCEAFEEGKKPSEHFIDRDALALRLKEIMRPGDVVLVKGSRGMQLEKLFDLLD